MPVDAKVPDAKAKGKKGKKGQILGLPWYVVAGGVVAAIALGLYLRSKSGGSSTSGDTGAATAQPQDTSGGAGSSGSGSSPSDSGAQNVDLTSLQDQLGQFESDLFGFLSTQPLADGSASPADVSNTTTAPTSPNGNPYVGAAAVGPASEAQLAYSLSQGAEPWQAALEGRGAGLNALYGIGAISQGLLVGNPVHHVLAKPSKAPVGHPQAPASVHPAFTPAPITGHPGGASFTPTQVAAVNKTAAAVFSPHPVFTPAPKLPNPKVTGPQNRGIVGGRY